MERGLIAIAEASKEAGKSEEVTKAQSSFVPVEVKSVVDAREEILERLEIVTPGGYVVRIP